MITFGKNKTQLLKGIALIFMIIHHTVASGVWATDGADYAGGYEFIRAATKMCVWIFAFLVGYGFFCSKNKSFAYSIKRVWLLVVPFWVILYGMFVPCAYASGTLVTMLNDNCLVRELAFNMLGISESLNWYSWFVCFYILTIFSMPYLYKVFEKYPKYGWIVSLMVYYIVSVAIHFFPAWDTNPLLHNLFVYTTLIPIVIVGYMCARWNKEGKIPTWFEGKNKVWISLLTIVIVLVLQSLNIPTKGFCLQAFYTPFLIFAIVGIFNSFELKWLSKVFANVGELSMYMWFFHAIFFTDTVNLYTKDLVFEPFHCFPYTFIMTFILTYAGSWIIRKILTPVINRIR